MSHKVEVRYGRRPDEDGRADAQAIYTMLLGFHDELGIAEIDHGRAYGGVLHMLECGLILMAEADGKLVGVLGLKLGELWFAAPGNRFLTNLFFYVPGERRNGRVTRALVAEAVRLKARLGVPLTIDIPRLVLE